MMLLGLLTGFCGSCTTFATWQFQNALELLSKDVVFFLVHQLTTFTASFIALRFGKHLAAIPKRYYFPEPPCSNGPTPSECDSKDDDAGETRIIAKKQFLPLSLLFVLLTVLVWCLAFLGPEDKRSWFVAVCFAPFGAGLRYLLSLRNPEHRQFPLFTFIPNVAGTAMNMTIAIVLNNELIRNSSSRHLVQLWLGKGLGMGCMGSLSTVSTWVNELDNLVTQGDTACAYVYGLASVVSANILALLLGGVWTATGHEL